jgi:hypothetical protein
VDTKVTDAAVFNTDTTLVAKATPSTYTIILDPGVGSKITDITGLTVTTKEGNSPVSDIPAITSENSASYIYTATYGTDITFKVAENDTTNAKYAVSGVVNTLNLGNENSGTMKASNGVYTLSGTDITRNGIKIVTSAVQYYTVTFKADGTTATMNETKAYAKSGSTVLYKDPTELKKDGETFAVPTATAKEGYRIADLPWKDDSEKTYTNEAIGKSMIVNGDMTLTAQTQKTWTVTFAAGSNGALETSASTTTKVDDGTAKTAVSMPDTTPDAGYKFDKWTWSTTGDTITSDITATANFVDASYSISFPTINHLTITPENGINNGVVTHGTEIWFTITSDGERRVDSITYTVGDSKDATELTPDVNGKYVIPGDAITGNISIQIETTDTVNVTFITDGNGTVMGSESYTTSYDAGTLSVTNNDLQVTGEPGYIFDKWTRNDMTVGTELKDLTLSSNVSYTYKAIFKDATYNVTLPTANSGTMTVDATHGSDYVITPDVASGQIVTGVTAICTVGSETQEITVANNNDGTFTIPGADIKGPITVTYTTIEGTFEYVTNDTYKAMELQNTTEESGSANQFKKLAILKTKHQENGTYKLTGYENAFYWSDKYEGYVIFVNADETDVTLAKQLVAVEGTATVIPYDGSTTTNLKAGDIDGNGIVNEVDGGMILDILNYNGDESKLTYTVDDVTRLKLDVDGNKQVTTSDAQWTVETYLGINHESN